tara:strand:- start:296 stop:502 length:207 start_codon:yes stop_codon:yes gene_type:complete
MKWIVIFFLSNGLEHIYGEVDYCDFAQIWEQVDIYEQQNDNDVTGWGCYDKETFLIREKAKERLGIDV